MPAVCSQWRRVQISSWLIAFVLASAFLFPANMSASSRETEQNASPQVKAGEAIFKQRCLVCHNKQPGDSAPFGPPNLYGKFKGPSAMSTKEAVNIIAHGKATMPAWGGILSKSDINNVIAYLRAR